MQIERLDHWVLTVKSIGATRAFYSRVLGMQVISFDDHHRAPAFGAQKINLHEQGREIEPKAHAPTPGSADLCLITRTPIPQVIEHLRSQGVASLLGPVERRGATGTIVSVYVRDPDLNLLEISNDLPIPNAPRE